MKGTPMKLFLEDGTYIGNGQDAAVYFKLSQGRMSHFLTQARLEGSPFADIHGVKVYLYKAPEKPKPKPRRFVPLKKHTLLSGNITHVSGQVWR